MNEAAKVKYMADPGDRVKSQDIVLWRTGYFGACFRLVLDSPCALAEAARTAIDPRKSLRWL